MWCRKDCRIDEDDTAGTTHKRFPSCGRRLGRLCRRGCLRYRQPESPSADHRESRRKSEAAILVFPPAKVELPKNIAASVVSNTTRTNVGRMSVIGKAS